MQAFALQRVLTASKDNTARFWEAVSGKLLATFQGHTDTVWSAVFNPGRPAGAHRLEGEDRAALGG
jgi:WD40 repeat protein